VEIKGVAHIRWIPELTHNEAFRQKALLEIKKILNQQLSNPKEWHLSYAEVDPEYLKQKNPRLKELMLGDSHAVIINLPSFQTILSFFTQPGKTFANELSDRLKVIACLEKPNLLHSEQKETILSDEDWFTLGSKLDFGPDDAQLLVWGPRVDVQTAVETIEERCRMAFEMVPNETRKALPDGTTIFERVLPGPDRMYPDTDSAPIPISENRIEIIRNGLPEDISERVKRLRKWDIPQDCYEYLLKRNLTPLLEKVINDFDAPPVQAGVVLGQHLKNVDGKLRLPSDFDFSVVYDLWAFVYEQQLESEIITAMLPHVCRSPQQNFDEILKNIGFKITSLDELLDQVPNLEIEFNKKNTSKDPDACLHWSMGQLRPAALGNVPLRQLYDHVARLVSHA
jgi:glutamyl-tRNA(Gln) amidotransferase subunit E